MLKRALPLVLDVLHELALTIWLGGLLLFWAATVPAVRQAGAISVHSASLMLGSSWKSLGLWAERCGVLMIAVQWLLRRRYRRNRALYIGDGVRQLLTFGALLLSEYSHRTPQINSQLSVGGSANSSPVLLGTSIAQIVLLLAVITLTTWLQRPQEAVSPSPDHPLPNVKSSPAASGPPSAAPAKRRRPR